MVNQIQKYIEEHRLLDTCKPVIVGLSGGADSVALLTALVQLGYNCLAAHCNFHLRGDESDRDEEFSHLYAKSLSVPFLSIDFDTKKYAATRHISIEMAARELRYNWFEQLMNSTGAQAIAVAHHQDDQVETILLNLVRGTGIRGMRGMLPRNRAIIRPLLTISKEVILEWLDTQQINYVTDSTNNATDYKRNYVRHEIVPALQRLNPSVQEAIVRSAGYFADMERICKHITEKARKELIDETLRIYIPGLLSYPGPETILYELLQPYQYNRFVVHDLFESLLGESGKLFESSTHQVFKDRDYLVILPKKEEQDKGYYFVPEDMPALLSPLKLSFEKIVLNQEFTIDKDKNTAYFDYDKISFPLIIRNWKQGDWFIPFGMKGRKKLSDFFSDNKYSIPEKEQQWLLCNEEDIIWVIGERSDNRYRVDQYTRNVLVVKNFG